ncbi:hypothetical protein OF829_13595 [Sphingomonas sp. LB-2]|uniref:hypothetical protein n=1 Tax=Sphingomonas caeni TaxID=2984949 RepID=UPI002230D1B2|nr:hypothetical protein [Sphingomonas caeni]MCW3848274.1 hypothetical protein [Sphingomonas caeni]
MIGSLILASAAFAATPPAPMLGGCAVSRLWGTTLPASMPADQERHVVHVQGKQIFWNSRLMTVERAAAEIGANMADGRDLLVIDASMAKCAVVKTLAAALEGPAACTPERCFVTAKPIPARKLPEEPAAPKP